MKTIHELQNEKIKLAYITTKYHSQKDRDFKKIVSIKYQVMKEAMPIYVMGQQDPRNFSINKSKCAGTITLAAREFTANETSIVTIKYDDVKLELYNLKIADIVPNGNLLMTSFLFATSGYKIFENKPVDRTGQIYNEYTNRWTWI